MFEIYVLKLSAGKVTLKDLFTVYRDEASVIISDTCRPSDKAAAEQILKAAEGEHPVYGIKQDLPNWQALKLHHRTLQPCSTI